MRGIQWLLPGMSCNGCRVLRKGCSETCVLRPCLQPIESADAQGHATVFVAKFFGRAGLMSFLTAVHDAQRPAVFQSLLYEAAGRTINPVSGAAGLLWAGTWHLCEAAVQTVLRGGGIRPLPEVDGGVPAIGGGDDIFSLPMTTVSCSKFSKTRRVTTGKPGVPLGSAAHREPSCDLELCWFSPRSPEAAVQRRPITPSMSSDDSVTTTGGRKEPELLNLFI